MADRTLDNPSADWWLKVSHARRHIERIGEVREAFLAERPWTLRFEPMDREHWFEVYLELARPVPADLSLIAGDVLHALRSGLDAFAFGLAQSRLGDELLDNPGLQRLSEFPIVKSPEDLTAWRARRPDRSRLFGDGDLWRLWLAQSYRWNWEAGRLGVGHAANSNEERMALVFDPLHRLQSLHNVDKHRRLHVAVLRPDMPHWFSDAESPSLRGAVFDPLWRDRSIVARVFDPPAEGLSDIVWDLDVALDEGPAGTRPQNVLDLLQGLAKAVEQGLRFAIAAPRHLTEVAFDPRPFGPL